MWIFVHFKPVKMSIVNGEIGSSDEKRQYQKLPIHKRQLNCINYRKAAQKFCTLEKSQSFLWVPKLEHIKISMFLLSTGLSENPRSIVTRNFQLLFMNENVNNSMSSKTETVVKNRD